MNKNTFLIILLFASSIVPVVAQNSATYDITFTSIWNANDHTNLPNNPHWSKLVGATHKTNDVFLKIGNVASPGIKKIAETGQTDIFNTEVTTKITNGEANQYINGSNLSTATGNILISDLLVQKDFPLLSLISMIAPSPDWIIALNSYNLLDAQGDWKTSVTLDLFSYDAGTDNGIDYSSPNSVTNPAQPISMMNGAPFNGKKIGILTITLKGVIATEKTPVSNQVNVYPNPVTNGNFIINGLEKLSIKKVDILNTSGSLIQSFVDDLNDNSLVINVNNLTSGIYILKITTNENNVIRRKFIVR